MTIKAGLYIDGAWASSQSSATFTAFNPSTEQPIARYAIASAADVDRAVAAAASAFPDWSTTEAAERGRCLESLLEAYERRADDLAVALSEEMGAPIDFSRASQVRSGANHLRAFIAALKEFPFVESVGPHAPDQAVRHEAVGVAALITPWNWPLNQIALKVGAALAAGCPMVLKPSEISPNSATIFAEIVDAAGMPKGVFNLVQGDGATTGATLAAHDKVDVISFTGSTRAGSAISRSAAGSIKRVSLELGGKSPSVVFADSDVAKAVRWTANFCFNNAGQSCNAATRLLVARSVYDEAVAIAAETARATQVAPAGDPGAHIGPLSSKQQFDKVQGHIEQAVGEGARLVAGGPGRPDALPTGWFARPTVFADVGPEHTLFREEVFGPVLAITPFDDEADAVALANDTEYGLSAYIHTADEERMRRVSRQVRAGMVQFNGQGRAPGTPFGGYKRSGNGREGGRWGIEEFLEVKLVTGVPAGGKTA